MSTAAPAPTANLDTALAQLRALVRADPSRAEQQAAAILAVHPSHGETLRLLARAHSAQRRTDAAIAALLRATRAEPDNPEGWRALGDQFVLKGDGAGADAAYARQIKTSVNDPALRHAAVALVDNQLAVVERILKPHLKAHPTDVAAIRMLAELAGRLGRYGDAEKLLVRAVELAPGFDQARFNLATVLYRQNRTLEAIEQLDILLDEDPDNPAWRNLKGAALGRIGDYGEAIAHFEAVLKARPGEPKLWMSYGHALKTIGRQEDGVAAYRRSIALAPGFGEAWWSLANMKTVRFDATDLATMEGALTQAGLAADDRLHLHFALGKAHEDRDAAEAAFRHYDAGNRLRREQLDYDPDETSRHVDRSVALFTPAFFAAHGGRGDPARDPIFILGMPRAGSTLIEQILASHSQVEGTQELPDIAMLARRLGERKLSSQDSLYPERLGDLDAPALAALGAEFLERTRVHRKTGRPLFIDKMPNNWAHVGLIHLILPNATIIDARRHPLGCCFSNFKQHFARGQAFSYGLDDMGRYYADYVRLMDHIDAVLPGRVHRIFYERMIDDTESEIRRLLDHLGLPFEPACLDFHRNDRAVRTASSEQVRQPIFRSGMDQWRQFDPWLQPLKDALGPVLATYPHG
ncbi:tetratricopeptide (TPR) repeat protein [Sphingomonas zeicaulis]|uniref:tetratricopeptide repeat-containing sulfotransferase family protein n=1 Tax=Sphingomonas zeicaulis TaxID=1632740 RepID=UPI003D1974B2